MRSREASKAGKKNNESFALNKSLFFFVSLCLCVGFSFCSLVFADQDGGQRPAAYLEMGVGGPQEAMAGAAAGTRNDVACGFYNPAGLSGIRGFQVEDQYTLLSLNQQLNYLGIANAFRDRFFYGLSWIYYSAGSDLEARTGPSLDPDSVFSDSEMTFIASIATRLSPRWSMGLNLKLYFQSLGTFSSGVGFGEDLGIQYRFTKDLTLGVVVQDIYTSIAYSSSTSGSSSDPEQIVPPTFKVGLADHEEQWNLKGNFDLSWSGDLGLIPRLGLEWRPMEALALRGGTWVGNLTSGASGGAPTEYFTAGVGLLIPLSDNLLEFDYSLLQDRLNPGAVIHQIALTGKFL